MARNNDTRDLFLSHVFHIVIHFVSGLTSMMCLKFLHYKLASPRQQTRIFVFRSTEELPNLPIPNVIPALLWPFLTINSQNA
jgi:hypothetical protein